MSVFLTAYGQTVEIFKVVEGQVIEDPLNEQEPLHIQADGWCFWKRAHEGEAPVSFPTGPFDEEEEAIEEAMEDLYEDNGGHEFVIEREHDGDDMYHHGI